jgi:hypothetical protein
MCDSVQPTFFVPDRHDAEKGSPSLQGRDTVSGREFSVEQNHRRI